MSAQTSYEIKQPVGYAGQLFDANTGRDVVSRDAESEINFGVAVSRGSDPDRQCVPGGVAIDYLGIAIRSLEREGANNGAISYAATETVGIIRTGYVWAVCPAGCVPGDGVLFTSADGVLDAGAAAAGAVQIEDATWETTTAAGELGVIRLAGTSATDGA